MRGFVIAMKTGLILIWKLFGERSDFSIWSENATSLIPQISQSSTKYQSEIQTDF